MFGVVTGRRYATLIELQTVYSLEDAYLMYEVIVVNNHNERLMLDRGRNGHDH